MSIARRLADLNRVTQDLHDDEHLLVEVKGISHLRTKPYRSQTNGKIERFHQTMGREWAYGMTYGSATTTSAGHTQRSRGRLRSPGCVRNLCRHDN